MCRQMRQYVGYTKQTDRQDIIDDTYFVSVNDVAWVFAAAAADVFLLVGDTVTSLIHNNK